MPRYNTRKSPVTESSKQPVIPRYLTVQGAAEYLSTTVWAIRQLLWGRKIPFGKVGKRFILDTHDLDVFFEQQKVKAA